AHCYGIDLYASRTCPPSCSTLFPYTTLFRSLDGQGDVRDALPLEVPLVGDVPVAADQVDVVGVDDPGHLRGGPDEVLPLLALAVGVGGGVEAASGMPHVAQHVVERLLDDAAE